MTPSMWMILWLILGAWAVMVGWIIFEFLTAPTDPPWAEWDKPKPEVPRHYAGER